MDVIADILLCASAIGAGFYCFVLSRRLTEFKNLDNGVGAAVATLSRQVDDLTKALNEAQSGASTSAASLSELTRRADSAAQRLELLVASMHDLPDQSPRPERPPHEAQFVRHRERSA